MIILREEVEDSQAMKWLLSTFRYQAVYDWLRECWTV